jgi:hypothetical protein
VSVVALQLRCAPFRALERDRIEQLELDVKMRNLRLEKLKKGKIQYKSIKCPSTSIINPITKTQQLEPINAPQVRPQ